MFTNKGMQAAAGGLIVLLAITACSSGGKTRATAQPQGSGNDAAVAADDRASSYDTAERAAIERERATPSDHIGTGEAGTSAADPAARAMAAACSSHRDAQGNIVYDDPTCPARYRSQSNYYLTKENAFYDRYTGWAARYAREAELAAKQGHAPESLRNAELALDNAKEAQRAGYDPALNQGILSLREALAAGAGGTVAAASLQDARVNLSKAAGIKVKDTRTEDIAAGTDMSRKTVKGELVRDTSTTGDNRYFLRDRNGKDTAISLSPDMSRQVHEGDILEAQVDPTGNVVAISKME